MDDDSNNLILPDDVFIHFLAHSVKWFLRGRLKQEVQRPLHSTIAIMRILDCLNSIKYKISRQLCTVELFSNIPYRMGLWFVQTLIYIFHTSNIFLAKMFLKRFLFYLKKNHPFCDPSYRKGALREKKLESILFENATTQVTLSWRIGFKKRIFFKLYYVKISLTPPPIEAWFERLLIVR